MLPARTALGGNLLQGTAGAGASGAVLPASTALGGSLLHGIAGTPDVPDGVALPRRALDA